jgi:hypothetical protein
MSELTIWQFYLGALLFVALIFFCYWCGGRETKLTYDRKSEYDAYETKLKELKRDE